MGIDAKVSQVQPALGVYTSQNLIFGDRLRVRSAKIFLTDTKVVSGLGKKLILWGGYDVVDSTPLSRVLFDYSTAAWAEVAEDSAPSPRSGHSAVWLNNKMYVFGGYDEEKFSNEAYAYDLSKNSWEVIKGLPENIEPRAYATAETFGGKIYIWGGMNESGTLNTRLDI